MVLGGIGLGLLVLLLVILSVRERIRIKSYREKTLPESKSSPLSQALAGLVGTAGGIYLSFVVLFNFLEVEIPSRVQVWQFKLEPLAAISLAVAILQPFASRMLFVRRKW